MSYTCFTLCQNLGIKSERMKWAGNDIFVQSFRLEKRRDHLGDLGRGMRILLNKIARNLTFKTWNELKWPRIGFCGGLL
jgi:hypothetical protein